MDSHDHVLNIRISVRLSTAKLALNKFKTTKQSYYLDEARRQIQEAGKIALSLLPREMTETNRIGLEVIRDEISKINA